MENEFRRKGIFVPRGGGAGVMLYVGVLMVLASVPLLAGLMLSY